MSRGSCRLDAAAEAPDRLEAIEAWLRERVRRVVASADHDVPVAFWTYSGGDGYPTTRRIAVPTWQDVRENYPLTVRERLGSLMTDAFRPAKGGQLLLWHGAPGTGKTFALRALAWEWRSWCDVHYITDPEVLFGAGSDYLVDVLLDDDDGYHKHRHDGAGQDGDAAQRWRLLVVEDTRRAPLRRRQRGARGKACRGCSTSSTA